MHRWTTMGGTLAALVSLSLLALAAKEQAFAWTAAAGVGCAGIALALLTRPRPRQQADPQCGPTEGCACQGSCPVPPPTPR